MRGKTKARKSGPVGNATLQGHAFLSELKKPMEALGKQMEIHCSFWSGCPEEDKEKMFLCIIRDVPLHHTCMPTYPHACLPA